MRAAVAVLLALCSAPLSATAPLALEVSLDPATATVGDRITATLTLSGAPADPARTPRFPSWDAGWGDAEVREVSAPERLDTPAGPLWRQHVVLTAFRTGAVPLPPVAVAVPGDPIAAVSTPADLALEIRSVLPEDPVDRERRPPAPPVPLEIPAAFWWTAAMLALAAALAAGALLHRRRRAGGAATVRLSAWQELVRELDAIDTGRPDPAHAAISLALRRFLGRSLSMPAAQSSTSELERRLAARGLDRGLVRRSARLLREVDQVKFARAAATVDELAERVAEAREIGEAVDLHLHPPAEESAA